MKPNSSVGLTTRLLVTVVAAMAIAMAVPPVSGLAEDSKRAEVAALESGESAAASLKADLAKLEEDWGIKLVGLRQTAAGYMLDLRFRVQDPEKAAPLLSRKIKRYVIVERSGAVLQVPSTEKLGSLRSSVNSPGMVKKDRIYGALFANPGRHVKAGDKVTLVLGDFRAEHVAVE